MARICMVAYTSYPTDSRVRREAEALVDRGDTVDVICLGEPGEPRVRTLNGVRMIQVVRGRYRGSSAVSYLVNYLTFFVAASTWLTALYLKHRYQVIEVDTMPDFMVFVALVPKLFGARVVLDVHDLMPELYQSKFGLGEKHPLIRFIAWMERRSVAFADRAIAVHRPHLDALVRHGNPEGKFTILLNLPDPKIFACRSETNGHNGAGFKLIYHGTIAERHGLQVAVRAISELRDQIPGLKFRVIGDGDGIPALIALVDELKLGDVVEVHHGLIPLQELAPVIAEADAGIVPILYDDFTRYMLPVKLLEYVALGKPVICSRTGTIEAYFDDSMVEYSTPGDVLELACHIRALSEDPGRRERLKFNADRFNREYNWQHHRQVYYQLIDSLAR